MALHCRELASFCFCLNILGSIWLFKLQSAHLHSYQQKGGKRNSTVPSMSLLPSNPVSSRICSGTRQLAPRSWELSAILLQILMWCPVHTKCSSLSHVRLFVTPWTIAHQVPLSMGILQARILERVAISFSRGSSQPRDQTHVSRVC